MHATFNIIDKCWRFLNGIKQLYDKLTSRSLVIKQIDVPLILNLSERSGALSQEFAFHVDKIVQLELDRQVLIRIAQLLT